MKYENKNNLPEYVREWLLINDYDLTDRGMYELSATELLKPAKSVVLSRIYGDTVSIDISELIASRIGTAMHDSFERAMLGERREERLHTVEAGYKISGKFDLIQDGYFTDIKTTSVWKYIHNEYQDYINQLSIYRWLLARNGSTVNECGKILFIFTDWQKAQYLRNPRDYPA